MSLIINSLLSVAILVINIYIWIVIIAALITFVNPDPYNPIVQFLRRATEPVFGFIRQKMPFVVINGIDLSPIVVIFALNILISILSGLYI